MPKTSLTDKGVKALPLPEKGQITYWDTGLKGFGVRVSQGGTKSFLVMLGADRRRTMIGKVGVISLKDARATARRTIAEHTLGRVRPAAVTFDEARDMYLDQCTKKNRAKTIRDYRNILNREGKFGKKNVADITAVDVLRRLKRLEDTPTYHHYTYRVFRAFFNHCKRSHLIEHSPMSSLVPPSVQKSRDRVLTVDELGKVYRTAMTLSTPFHKIVALCIQTGQRKGEIAHLQWDWIDDDTISLPAEITKNKKPNVIPTTDQMWKVINSCSSDCMYLFPAARIMDPNKTTVFNGWSKSFAAFKDECGVHSFRVHDLRRSVATVLAEQGAQQVWVEKLLNHTSGGTQSPIAQVYNRYQYRDEIRTALVKYHTYLDTLI
ncbi:MAG: tyrosine-type recombinase/integrase [Gammaproteobacteria bacterium]|nr:tyrosine-type recombinase/integrase [Gammaproteobacteria bacterium]